MCRESIFGPIRNNAMKQLLLLLSFSFGLTYGNAQNQSVIHNHITSINALITKHKASFDSYQVKEINAIKWNAAEFDDSFLYFFSHYQPHYDTLNNAFKTALNEWTVAIRKDMKLVTEADVRSYIAKIKKMPDANLTMWYFINVYANFFYSQKTMQDKRPE